MIIISFSRSAIIAAILIAFIFSYEKLGKKSVLVVILVSLIGFAAISNKYVASQIERTSTWDTRNIIWTNGLKAIVKKPILGYGQENFEPVFPKNLGMNVDSAHNIFLQIVIETGFVGLALFLYILYLSSRSKNKMLNLSILTYIIVAFFNPVSVAEIAIFWFILGLANSSSD